MTSSARKYKLQKPTLSQINSVGLKLFGIEVYLKTRKREVVRQRQCLHYVANRIYKYSLADTGARLGGKDHATTLHSCRTIENEKDNYPYIADYIDSIIYNLELLPKPTESHSDKIRQLLKSKTLDINVKIELRNLLKCLK